MTVRAEGQRRAEVERDFRRVVAQHSMQVLHEDGVYRHLRFSNHGSSVYRFDLVTYPGFLVYSGDMGCFVFERLHDMLEFFRHEAGLVADEAPLYINTGYWLEKLQAVDGQRHHGSATEFDPEKFRAVVNEHRVGWMRAAKEGGLLDKQERRALWEAVDDEVLSLLEDSDDDGAQRAAHNFHWGGFDPERRGWAFVDLFEHNFTRYTSTFLWCCYALAWGVREYDKAKQGQEVAA